MMRTTRVSTKTITKVVLNVFIFIVILWFGDVTVNAGTADVGEQTVTLSLHSKNTEENVPFSMSNMFPGDSTTQYYRVSVSYTGTITVKFQATVKSGGEKLSEVLEMKVRRTDNGQLLYEGMLEDMPLLEWELSTDSKSQTEELPYEITAGLSTSVGNEYQNKSLTMDLAWWAEGGADEGEDPTKPSEPESGEVEEDKVEDEVEEEEVADTPDGSLTDPPRSGDDSRIFLWFIIVCGSIAAMIAVVVAYRRRERAVVRTRSRRRLFWGFFVMTFLVMGLGITTLALVWQKVIVEENLFVTGTVSISLNDDQPIFREDMLFEPGMVVKKDFTLRNDSTCDVHYRLYFTNVDGDFAEVLQVEVQDGVTAIFEGSMAAMNGQKSEGADGVLREGEERVMTIVFRVPEDCGNVMQGRTVLFDLQADAVQVVNNPEGLFE